MISAQMVPNKAFNPGVPINIHKSPRPASIPGIAPALQIIKSSKPRPGNLVRTSK